MELITWKSILYTVLWLISAFFAADTWCAYRKTHKRRYLFEFIIFISAVVFTVLQKALFL